MILSGNHSEFAMEKVAMMKRKNMSCNKDEMAIYEVTRGYEIMKLLQFMFLFGGEPQGEPPEVLFEKGLQALEMSLSILKYPSDFNHDHETSSSGCSFSDQGSTVVSDEIKSTLPAATGSCKKELKSMNSCTKVTYSPHDGYQWRKYGQKKIQKTKLSRSYYRCTYKDQGCQATKQVEEKVCNIDQPLFLVTYTGHHTCKPMTNPIVNQQVPLLPIEANLLSFESNSNMIFKKECPMLSSLYSASDQQANNHEEVHKMQTPASSSSTILNYHHVSAPYQISLMGSEPSDDNHDGNKNSLVSIAHQRTVESMANNEEFSEPKPGTDVEDIFSFACLSPPWHGINMDYSMMDPSATDDDLAFQLANCINGVFNDLN